MFLLQWSPLAFFHIASRQTGALAHSCLSSGTAVVAAAAGPNLGAGVMPFMFIPSSVAMLRNIKKLLRKSLDIREPVISESAEKFDKIFKQENIEFYILVGR